jgi:hypothetical protein
VAALESLGRIRIVSLESFVFSTLTSFSFLPFTAVKGVSYTLLVRLGVLWGVGPGGCDKGIFGRNWGCHSDEEIESIYAKLVELLGADGPFAPFDTLTFLMGEKNARSFCDENLNFHYRPPPVQSGSHDDVD